MAFSIGSLLAGMQAAGSIAQATRGLVGAFKGTGGTSVGPAAFPFVDLRPGPGFSVTDAGKIVATGSPEHFRLEPHARVFRGRAPSRATFQRAVFRPPGTAMVQQAALGPVVRGLVTTAGRVKLSPAFRTIIRELGIVGAATVLGISALELAEAFVSQRPRRRRGITAAAIRTTKATIRRIDSLNRQISAVCPPATRRRRAPARRSRVHAAVDV